MIIDRSPVKVEVDIEAISVLEPTAFKTTCFISENDIADRSLLITSIDQLYESDYELSSSAYNFCRDLLSYNNGTSVLLRAKRSNESYVDAYNADYNSNFYFITIESKDVVDVLTFNDYVQSDMCLQFFSTNQDVSLLVGGRRLVYYYQTYFGDYILYDSSIVSSTDSGLDLELTSGKSNKETATDVWLFDNYTPTETIMNWDTMDKVLLDYKPLTPDEADKVGSYYPEASWIGRCSGVFPSRVQWLYKNLNYVDIFEGNVIPNLSNTSVLIKSNKSTVGTGSTTRGYPIDQEISLDWVKWATQYNMFSLLKNSEKVNATQDGLFLFEQKLKQVLDFSVEQGIFTKYIITGKTLDRVNNKVGFTFDAYLQYSILGVDKVEGVVYH